LNLAAHQDEELAHGHELAEREGNHEHHRQRGNKAERASSADHNRLDDDKVDGVETLAVPEPKREGAVGEGGPAFAQHLAGHRTGGGWL
jgi:hypothetical protein